MRLILVYLFPLLLLGCATLKPDAARALKMHAQAEALYLDGKYADALPLFQRLARDFPSDSEFQLRIGNCYARAGHLALAVDAYELAVLRDSSSSRAWYNLSYVRAQMLADTVVQMHEHVDPTDPNAAQMRKLVAEVLAPFGLAAGVEQLEKNTADAAASPAALKINRDVDNTAAEKAERIEAGSVGVAEGELP